MNEYIVVRSSIRKMKYPDLAQEDIEDLEQEAAIALWKNANCFDDDDRSRAYAFSSAVRACCKYIARSVFGCNPSSTVEYNDEIELGMDFEADEVDIMLPDDVLEALADIFMSARVQRRGRAIEAAMRDVSICAMVYSGYTNKSIAQELGLDWRTVQQYRQRIRQVLRRYCQEHDIQIMEV